MTMRHSLGASVAWGLAVVMVAGVLPAYGQNAPAPAGAAQPADAKPVLSGKVTDKAGKAVAKARVQLAGPDFQQTQTDAQGDYAFKTIRTAGQYQVGVTAQGFLPVEYWRDREAAMQLTPQSQATRDIVLERGANIVVTVTNAAGDTVKGARVDGSPVARDYRNNSNIESVMSDDSGTATLTVPPSKKQYIVCANMDGFAPAHALVTAESIDEPVDVTLALEKGETLKGVAICNDGKPATGWQIYATPEWWTSNYSRPWAKIDAQGNFTLKDLGPGVHKLSLGIPMGNNSTMVRELQMTLTIPAAQQPVRLDLPMASPGTQVKATGKVRVTGGRPDYVSVNAVGTGAQDRFYEQVDFSRSMGRPGKDSVIEGTYTFSNLPAGTYTFQFSSPNTEYKALEQVKIPGEIPVLELKVIGKPHLTGAITDAAGGTPVSQFSIRARKTQHLGSSPNYGQEPRWVQVSDPQGKFDLEVISAGVYQVQVKADGYATVWSKDIRVESPEAKTETQIKLTAGGTLGGMVTDASGKPVEGAKVSPFSVAGYESRMQAIHFHPDLGAVKTDASGRFTLAHLAAGDEKIRIVHPDFAPKTVTNLKVTEGQSADAGTIKLSTGGSAEGVVYDANGRPAASVPVEFRDQQGWSSGEDEAAGRLALVTTDEEGKFRAEHLPELTMYLMLQDSWNRQGTVRRIIHPLEGKTTHVNFGGTNAITGTIIGPNGPVANARVQLAGDTAYSDLSVTGKTDAAGKFALYGPPPGKYSLYFMTDLDRQNPMWVKDIEIPTPARAVDLGELKAEGTEVVITLQGDDPADLEGVQYVTLESQEGPRRYNPAERDPATGIWRAKSVAPGKYRAGASTKTGVSFAMAIECSANEKAKPVTIRVPKATATLSASMGKSEALPTDVPQIVLVANEDMTVATHFSAQGEQPRTVKLPPGTYRLLEYGTRKPREGMAPITLADGETKVMEIPLPLPVNTKNVVVQTWSADGVLASGFAPRVLDGDGKEVERTRMWNLGGVYTLAPGHYRAVVDRPGASAATKEFDVTATDKVVNVDMYLPE